MLINNWYVACASEELPPGRPRRVQMLGCHFVLFRDRAGRGICLSDTCVHRGAALGDGEIVDGDVACPYHGWRFGADGRCTLIPALGPGVAPPKRVRVDDYPTAEKYGWIWVFLGDLPESRRPRIPDLFPEYDEPGAWRRIPYQFEAKANWMRFEENSLDTAHTNFVHRAFGAKRTPRLEPFPIEMTEWGARVAREKPAPQPDQKSGEIAKLLAADRRTTSVTLEFSLIGLCHRIQPTFREGMSQINFTARTPIDPWRSRAIGWQARNYLLEPEHDAERMAGILQAVEEDLRVVENVVPPLTPASLSDEFLTETDGMEVAFRKTVARHAALGNEIDVDALEMRRRREVLVIPSPARAADPQNWVHRTVPLRGA